MESKIYLFLLLLCGLLSQGICSLSNENNETSSDIHIRQKRIAGGAIRPRNENPFLVAILLRGSYYAPASLLSLDTAITSAHIFQNQDLSKMSLESRTAGGQRNHDIVRLIFLDLRYNDARPTFNNLVLVRFGPPIFFSVSLNRPISIHNGSIVDAHLAFELYNWGKPFRQGRKLVSLHHRAIPVQLISIQYCQQIYPGLIGPGNICTNALNAGQHGTDRDSGAPLIVDQHLLGIMVFHGPGRATNPDVFMNLMDLNIMRWIHEHVPALHLF